jgi:hypothetical protein
MNISQIFVASFLVITAMGRAPADEGGSVFFEGYPIELGGLSGWAEIVHDTNGTETDLSLRVGFPSSRGSVATPPILYQDLAVSLSDAAGHSVTLQPKGGAGDKYSPGVSSASLTGIYEIPKGWPLPDSRLVLNWASRSVKDTVTIGRANDEAFAKKVQEVMDTAKAIKPGQTRRDLRKEFTTEGGISLPTQRRYVSRACPIIKVDVVLKTRSDGEESLEDEIVSVSKPFIESSIWD